MSILAWIEDQREGKFDTPKYNHQESTPTSRSKGLWTRCDNCGVILYIKHLKENKGVCFGCGYHLQMESRERILSLIDSGTWRPLDETLSPLDPLGFKDQKPYIERLRDAQKKTGLQDAIQTGTGLLDGIPIALGVMDFGFMGGSMGSVVGEKITRLIEYATEEGYTLILVCASGGARMQEGIYSLMQMAKISSALQVYQSCANLLYISVITSPTTGGVTASFAMLGDLIFAEPKALIGFAGRRVIEQTLQEDLPDDFQTAEYLLHHGLLDLIVPRCFLKAALSEIIYLYKNAPKKSKGAIPYGITKPLSFLEIESILRAVRKKPILKPLKESNANGEISRTFAFKGTKQLELSQKGNHDNSLSFNSSNEKTLAPTSGTNKLIVQERTGPSLLYSKSRASFKLLKESFNGFTKKSNFLTSAGLYQDLNEKKCQLPNVLGQSSTSTLLSNKKNYNKNADWLSTIELATSQKIRWINQKNEEKGLKATTSVI